MRKNLVVAGLTAGAVLLAGAVRTGSAGPGGPEGLRPGDYLPGPEAAGELVVTTGGPARAAFVVQTQAVAVKEDGPAATVARFGEVYAFAPAFLAVHRDEPTRIRLWNLQADDEHDFMLMDSAYNVLMKVGLPPLEETAFVFTFHREGLYDFTCTMHRPEMSGQILVLPPREAPGGPQAGSSSG